MLRDEEKKKSSLCSVGDALTCRLDVAEGGVIRLWSSKGLRGVFPGRWVARQYTSRYSAKCSHASSSWFSSRMTSNMSYQAKMEAVSHVSHQSEYQKQSVVKLGLTGGH